MKREFEKVLEQRIETIELIEKPVKEIKLDKNKNKRYTLLQKLKLSKQRIERKQNDLKTRKQNLSQKFEQMNSINEELTIQASGLEHRNMQRDEDHKFDLS